MASNRMSCLLEQGGVLTVPIFHVSSVSGLGLALMHSFLRALPTGSSSATAFCLLGAITSCLQPPLFCQFSLHMTCTQCSRCTLSSADGFEPEEDPNTPLSPVTGSSAASEATQDKEPAHFQA